jgi:hypothetical protein
MTQSERVDDGHGRNGQDDEVSTIPSSGLFSPLSTKEADRVTLGTQETSPESVSSAQRCSAEVNLTVKLGQWIASPDPNNGLILPERRNSYGSNASTQFDGLESQSPSDLRGCHWSPLRKTGSRRNNACVSTRPKAISSIIMSHNYSYIPHDYLPLPID